MKALLTFLLVFNQLNFAMTEESNKPAEEFILPETTPQKVYGRYQTNFGYQHDRGFYLSATLGPQWNHSIQNPAAKALRFGGKFGLGWYVADGIALHGAAWGNFLEQATLVAVGPGIAFLFDGPNMGLDFSFGIGRAFNAMKKEDYADFAETVVAANLSFSKLWWLSSRTSLGLSLMSGLHGLTVMKGKLSSIGWNVGLGMAFLIG